MAVVMLKALHGKQIDANYRTKESARMECHCKFAGHDLIHVQHVRTEFLPYMATAASSEASSSLDGCLGTSRR
jgi:hypothetical protein